MLRDATEYGFFAAGHKKGDCPCCSCVSCFGGIRDSAKGARGFFLLRQGASGGEEPPRPLHPRKGHCPLTLLVRCRWFYILLSIMPTMPPPAAPIARSAR